MYPVHHEGEKRTLCFKHLVCTQGRPYKNPYIICFDAIQGNLYGWNDIYLVKHLERI